jgi:tRNA threonylcarbamoyl adenosine modification protein YeaZ
MRILALDFSSSQRSVAAVQPLTGAEAAFQSEVVEAGGRSTKAFNMIERALAEARLEREMIECIAVGLGPGSYTGIRAAIALAQGWQLAQPIKLIGISTVEVLAAQVQKDGLQGPIHLVFDAQRGEFYIATWEFSETVRTETEPLRIVSRVDIEACLAAGAFVLGPDLKRVFPQVREVFPSARILGNLALGRTDFERGEDLKPIYLRKTNFVKASPPRVV